MKIKEFCVRHRKRIIITAISAVVVLGIAGGAVYYFLLRDAGDGDASFTSIGAGISMSAGGSSVTSLDLSDAVTASGVTSVGMTQEAWEVENLSNILYVEEVYISSGDEVAEGDLVLKLTDDSVEEARDTLETLVREAELACRTGAIEYQQSLITAEYDRDLALANAEYAQTTYDNTVASLTSSVERAQEALEEVEEQIAEYEEMIASGDYYSYYQVGELKELYDDNRALLVQLVAELGVDWSQVTGSGGGGAGSSGASSDKVMVCQELYTVLEQNEQDYEEALANYEDAVANAELNLQSLQLSLSSLKEELAQARENYDTQVLQAQLTYESTMASAERAESDYETAVEAAESEYESLLDDYEDAQENLALFESTVGDGYYRAQGSGSVLSVTLRANQYLSSDSVVFVYSNTEEMTVTVSVDQADIASVSVGESVYVQSSESGLYSGTVTSINPVSSSSSRSSVTYEVTVTLSGDVQNLSTNETVSVIFGLDLTGMDSAGTADGEMDADRMGAGGASRTDRGGTNVDGASETESGQTDANEESEGTETADTAETESDEADGTGEGGQQ
ncbi:MAG: HlyD family efflux transporter periplasmic adaptor subunit [Lachnospiraceae bacterium]|nr:HlyD family efflux transporter periplasmic adaptor subunit [Lachnospiraceae bacterium]